MRASSEESDLLYIEAFKPPVSTEYCAREPYVKCYLANVQSLRNKLPEFQLLLNSAQFDVIGFTETFLTSRDPDSLILAGTNDYALYRCDRLTGRGGGVALCCRHRTGPVHVQIPSPYAVCECVAVDLCSVLSYRIICAYRPPNATTEDSLLLYELLTWLTNCERPVVVLGDFNLPSIEWSMHRCPSSSVYTEFMRFVETQGLVQTVSEPTRLQNVLDLVLTSDELLISNVCVEPSFGNSDHSSVEFELLSNMQPKSSEQQQWTRNFRKLDVFAAKQLLGLVNWNSVFSGCDCVQQMWDALRTVLEDVFDKTVPWVKVGAASRAYPKFITKLQARKRRLFKAWKRLGTAGSKQAYRNCCRECTEAIRSYQLRREERILSSGNRSQFYSYVNEQRTVRAGVAPLVSPDGSIAVSDYQKSSVLSEQFCSVFTRDNDVLPTVKNKCPKETFSDFVITGEAVRKVLCKLKLKYCKDPDGIPSAVLRILSYELCQPLATVFRKSLASGKLPISWKTADITALFKKGSSSAAENYRPISITSSVCRVFERVLLDHLLFFVLRNKLLSDEQFGFLKRRSTELQLLACVDSWSKALDASMSTDIVYIDFAKAFDTVCHKKLLYKLEHVYSIRGNVLQWISSFLQGRLQRVKVGMSYSEYKPVLSSVPQGSVLGPLLFLLYINDVATLFPPEVFMKMFADDLKIYMSFRYAYERGILHTCLQLLSVWSDESQLRIQSRKCGILTVGKAESGSYEIDKQPLPNLETVSDLGVSVDCSLSFSVHVSNIVSKAHQSLSVLFRCFVTHDLSALVLAYSCYVRPILEYACTVWNPVLHRRSSLGCLSSIDKIESVQRYFTRRLLKRCLVPEMCYLDRLKMLNLEPLELRRLKFSMCMVFKIVYGLVDVNCSDFFELSASVTRGHKYKLRCPPFSKDARQNFFSVAAVPIWNKLPELVVCSPTLHTFKNRLDNNCNDMLLNHCVFDRNL